eukprot:scaffold132412_cov26-Tisochrysis_lutea.AAC.5
MRGRGALYLALQASAARAQGRRAHVEQRLANELLLICCRPSGGEPVCNGCRARRSRLSFAWTVAQTCSATVTVGARGHASRAVT